MSSEVKHKASMEKVSTDVLIIGAGAAGIQAALAASKEGADVLVVAKQEVTHSGSSFSPISQGWGIQALLGDERTPEKLEAFYQEVMEVGLGKCAPDLVRILVEESGPRLEELMAFGLRFKKEENGKYIRLSGCFSDQPRAFVTETMANVRQCFRLMLERSGAKVVPGRVLKLMAEDGQCWGGWLLTTHGAMVGIHAGATVLATGGAAGIYRDHLVSDDCVGDGYVLAHKAGAALDNLAFIQFMLGLRKGKQVAFLPLSGLRHPTRLRSRDGQDVLAAAMPEQDIRDRSVEARQRHFPFSCRDISFRIDQNVACNQGTDAEVVWLGEHGFAEKDPPRVVHLAHAFNGGIRIDEKGESSVEGLFAAGEVAAGPHGADRIGGCMMTATQVFGNRAGRFGADLAKRRRTKKSPQTRPPQSPVGRAEIGEVRAFGAGDVAGRAKEALSLNASVVRNVSGLQRCLDTLRDCSDELEIARSKGGLLTKGYWQEWCLIEAGRLVVQDAIRREYSLGSHFRKDFPPTDISS
jgi:fumarate reductase (CoM/CoB) subunit A